MLNSLIGEKILPFKVTHCTTKVCRIRNSEKLSVSLKNDKGELKHWPFESTDAMKEFLKGMARTEDIETSFLDICLPVPLIEV